MCKTESESCSVVSDSLRPHGLHSSWNSPGQTTGMSSYSLLLWIFLTQELNRGLLHCRQIVYQLSYHNYSHVCTKEGLHWWLSDKESSCNAEDAGDVGSIPGEIPWRRAWQPTPVFLPGESPRTEKPSRLHSMGLQRVRHN